ncbi:E3 ubiquitin-protein ligase RNF34-like isoform X3 [Cetorhinus maximus]
MKAGATSMWASCCGLLNEVMGTGTVRGQQPGFSGGTGPFRFAHSTGYSSYPSPMPEVPNIVCKGCGQAFSLFRKKGREDTTSPMSRGSESQQNQEYANGTNDDIPPKKTRASLSDLSSTDDVEALTVRQLKEILARNFVSFSGCCEKWELVERVKRLFKETEENRKFLENGSNPAVAAVEEHMQLGSDENLCRICMDAVIDCVLLECGHMVTCTKCGKRMNECPICRQYVVRAVHVFKS